MREITRREFFGAAGTILAYPLLDGLFAQDKKDEKPNYDVADIYKLLSEDGINIPVYPYTGEEGPGHISLLISPRANRIVLKRFSADGPNTLLEKFIKVDKSGILRGNKEDTYETLKETHVGEEITYQESTRFYNYLLQMMDEIKAKAAESKKKK